MDRNLVQAQLRSIVGALIPANSRRFKYVIFDQQPQRSGLGFYIDPKPFDGIVVARTTEAIVVKTGRTAFAVLDRTLVTEDIAEGVKVHVAPYARRRFDGLRADTPEERTEYTADGAPYTVKSIILGSAPAPLPIPKPTCPELATMIEQLEKLPAPNGFRRITHMLVDAGAKDFAWSDPAPDQIIQTPPAISFNVATLKFVGRVTVLYDRGADVYVVELHHEDRLVEKVDDVYFDTLGQTLERLIDDETWRHIRIQCISTRVSSPASAKPKSPRVAASETPRHIPGDDHAPSF